MTKSATWQSIEAEVKRRISERIWKPGELIPGETQLAGEFGCARATVNRALRQLADAGLLERRRKGGTRVTRYPVRKATLDIPMTRKEVEQRGAVYSFKLLHQQLETPPDVVGKAMGLGEGHHLHIKTLHMANGTPFMFEDRWVNVTSTPDILQADLGETNANEWLIEHALFTQGDIGFSADNATREQSGALGVEEGQAVFVITRTTWNNEKSITHVRLAYSPGFEMQTHI